MDKLLTFETHTDKGVFLYTLGEGRDQGYLTKTAGSGDFHPEIATYIQNCKPMPGQIQVLLTALGAGEYWGSNVNGDFFPADALRHSGQEYGHKTFETMAHVYKHHINKDPAKSYGRVILSVWNERMKRVELIVTLEEAKAPDLVEKINNGEYPEVSMGCKVPYDVCSICGNKAKTRKDYCDHLRYSMNKIPPGHSKIAYALNTIPKFFDISFVLIGADRIAKVMKKVANSGSGRTHPLYGVSSAQVADSVKTASANPASKEVQTGLSKEAFLKGASTSKMMKSVAKIKTPKAPKVDAVKPTKVKAPKATPARGGLFGPETAKFAEALGLDKKADQNKKAEMIKEVPSNLDGNTVGKIVDHIKHVPEVLHPFEPEIPKKVIIHITDNNRGMHGLSKILSTILHLGIVPKPKEFQSIALRSLGKDKLADDYERMGLVFDPHAKISKSQACSCQDAINAGPENFNGTVSKLLEPYIEDRSYCRPVLAKRVIRLVKLAEEGNLTYPKSEHVKIATEDESNKIGLLPMMATLTGLYMAMKHKLPKEDVKGLTKILYDHPALVAALGVGGYAAATPMFGRTVKGQYDFHPDNEPVTMGTWQEEIERKNANPITKTAGPVASFFKRTFVGAPLLYMASGIMDVNRARNPYEQEGVLAGTIRKHPDMVSAALAGEALAGLPVTRRIGGLIRSGSKFLRKTGSISDEALSTAVFSLAFPGSSAAVRAASTAVDYGIISGIEKLLSKKEEQQGGTDAKY